MLHRKHEISSKWVKNENLKKNGQFARNEVYLTLGFSGEK